MNQEDKVKRPFTDLNHEELRAETLENLFQQGTLNELALESIRRMTPSYHPQYQELTDLVRQTQCFI